jgi:hypothetical protein
MRCILGLHKSNFARAPIVETVSEPSSPFEFEEETATKPERGKPSAKDRLLRWSVILAVVSFLASLIASVVENNSVGNLQVETTASAVNRFGMVMMLIGCLGIFVAFRFPQLLAGGQSAAVAKRRWSTWWLLFAWNLAAIVFLGIFLFSLAMITDGEAMIYCVLPVPLVLSLMLVIAIWHRGVIRAYAIGFLVSAVLNLLLLAGGALYLRVAIGTGYLSTYSPGTVYALMSPTALSFWIFLGLLGIGTANAISGLVCSGYVAVLERVRRSREPVDAQAHPTINDLQLPTP